MKRSSSCLISITSKIMNDKHGTNAIYSCCFSTRSEKIKQRGMGGGQFNQESGALILKFWPRGGTPRRVCTI